MGSFSLTGRNGVVLIGLIVLSLLFALSRMPGGIGGTGITGAPGGIGGTGIYGRIDAFGSIWVNGVEVFYAEDQNVVRQGRDGLPDQLKIGQLVAVHINDKTGRAEAQSIEIIEEVNGPIENLRDGKFVILGQIVILNDATIIDEELIVGHQIAVSGFRHPNGSIIASYIAKPLVNGEMSLRGTLSRIEDGRYWIGEQEISLNGEGVKVGQIIEVRGRLDAERPTLIVDDYKTRELPFDQRHEKISYQGLIGQEFNTSVIEFTPEIDDEVLVIPTVNIENIKTDIQNSFKRDGIEKSIRENRRKLEEEARRQVEVNARRQGEIEARRQAEFEGRRQAELEARRQTELETRRQTEIEARRQAEIESRRQAELEARRQSELEARRQTELEARRQTELEARRQSELEARRLSETEVRRQAQLQALKQAQFEARSEEEQEALRQMESELRRKTDGELRDEIRRQIRTQSRLEIQDAIRQEMRRRIRRQLRQQIMQ